MPSEQEQKLAEQLEAILATGDEAAAKKFVIEHLKEFPESAQRSFALGIFSDAMDEIIRSNEELLRMKETAVGAIDEFEEEERNGKI